MRKLGRKVSFRENTKMKTFISFRRCLQVVHSKFGKRFQRRNRLSRFNEVLVCQLEQLGTAKHVQSDSAEGAVPQDLTPRHGPYQGFKNVHTNLQYILTCVHAFYRKCLQMSMMS